MIRSWEEFIKLSDATMLMGPLSDWPVPASPEVGGGLPRRRMFWEDCVAAATKESCSYIHMSTCMRCMSEARCKHYSIQ